MIEYTQIIEGPKVEIKRVSVDEYDRKLVANKIMVRIEGGMWVDFNFIEKSVRAFIDKTSLGGSE